MQWDPRDDLVGDRRPGTRAVGAAWLEPSYMCGALRTRADRALRRALGAFVALALLLLAYQTAAALAFVGATRYRVAWDFLLALLAAATLEHVIQRCAHAMRVLHVHRIRGIGGSERHLLTLLPALAERGVEPRARRPRRSRPGTPTDFYDALRVPSVRVRSPRDLDPLLLARLVRELARPTSCTRISCTPTSTAALGEAARRTLVSTKHNDDPFRRGAVPLRRARPRAAASTA